MAEKVTVCYAEVDNKPGVLAEVLGKAAAAGVDLSSMMAFASGGGKGRIYGVPKAGCDLSGLPTTTAIGIQGGDVVGAAAKALQPLAAAGIDIIACGAYAAGGEMTMLIIVEDVDKALEVLG